MYNIRNISRKSAETIIESYTNWQIKEILEYAAEKIEELEHTLSELKYEQKKKDEEIEKLHVDASLSEAINMLHEKYPDIEIHDYYESKDEIGYYIKVIVSNLVAEMRINELKTNHFGCRILLYPEE